MLDKPVRQRLIGISGRRGHPQILQHFGDQATGQRAVIHHQHPLAAHGHCRALERATGWHAKAHGEGELEEEEAPLTLHAVDLNIPAHLVNQVLTDGQPEPTAAIATGHGFIGLAECLKELALLLGTDADATILHLEL